MKKLTLQVERLEDRCTPASVAELGWTGGPIPIAEQVDQELTTADAHTGDGSWRMSNAGDYNGMFHGFPMSPALGTPAAVGTAADMFVMTFWFKSVSDFGDGSEIEIDMGTGTDRNNYLSVINEDGGDGLQLWVGGNLSVIQVAVNMDRTQWHRIDVAATFRDGPDTLQLFLDGVDQGEYPTLEPYFIDRGDADAEAKIVDRVFFRSGTDADNPAGFYFDDLAYSSRESSSPNTLIASYETSFNHGGTPEHWQQETRQLTRRELALLLVEEHGWRWRRAWRVAGRMLRRGA